MSVSVANLQVRKLNFAILIWASQKALNYIAGAVLSLCAHETASGPACAMLRGHQSWVKHLEDCSGNY